MLWVKKILKNDGGFLIGLLVLTLIIYATSWFNEFVSDDIAGIAQNPTLGNFWLQVKTLNLNNILNSFIYKVFGLTPFWYHLLNTAFHLATVVVIYLLTSVIVGLVPIQEGSTLNRVEPYRKINIWLPRLTSLLFALHPIETEGVTWISGLPYAVYTFFFLLGLIFFILAINYEQENQSSLKKIAISTLFFILALSSSEKAVVFPVILIVYIFLFSRFNRKSLSFLVPSTIIAFIYIFARLSDVGGRARYVASPTGTEGVVVFNPLIQVPIAIYSYLKLLFFPLNLTLYHEFVAFPRWEYYLAVVITLCLIALIIFLIVTGLKRSLLYRKIAAFGLLFFIISLGLTLLPINIAWVVAERYVHLGSVGIFLAAAATIYSLIQNKRLQAVVAGLALPATRLNLTESSTFNKVEPYRAIVILFILIYTPLTIKRNLEWRSQDTLWPATVRESPLSAYAWNNMGDYYGRYGDIENSIRAFERARELRPRYADATHNLANAHLKINEATKAAELYKEALEYNPTLYQSYQQLGQIALSSADYQAAENYFLQSATINPDPFTDYLYLYIIYSKTNNKEKAEQALIFAQRLSGGNQQRIQLIQQVVIEAE